MKRISITIIALFAIGLGGCTADKPDPQQKTVDTRAKKFKAYLPHNDVELRNYNDSQKLYDSPDSIIWCTTTWGNPSAPMVTIPVTGKLTSSSTTFFNPEGYVFDTPGDGNKDADTLGATRSVDGLFHPNPPQYRYGFTPGHQYVDFFNMPTLCTTAMSKFQRQATTVTTQLDPEAQRLTAQAERQLAAGDGDGAQKTLEALGNTVATTDTVGGAK